MAKKSNKKTNQGKAPEEWKKKKPVNPNSKAAVSQTNKKKKEPKKGKDGKAAKPSLWQRFKNYIIAVKAEMHRVVWPTKEELLSASLIVIGALIFFGVLIFIVDNLIVIPLDSIASLSSSATDAASTASDLTTTIDPSSAATTTTDVASTATSAATDATAAGGQ